MQQTPGSSGTEPTSPGPDSRTTWNSSGTNSSSIIPQVSIPCLKPSGIIHNRTQNLISQCFDMIKTDESKTTFVWLFKATYYLKPKK